MVWDEQASQSVHATLIALLNRQTLDPIGETLAAIEARIATMIQAQTLTPFCAINAVDCLLLLERPYSAKALIDYINVIRPGDACVQKLAAYLSAENPTADDIIKASFCLKSSSFDAFYDANTDSALGTISTIAQKNNITKMATIVDLGCGTGQIGAIMRRDGFTGTLIGVDLSPEMLAIAEQKALYSRVVCCGALEFVATVERGSFDAAFLLNLAPLLKLPEMLCLLDGLFGAIAPGGPIVFNLPNVGDIRADRPTALNVEPTLRATRTRYSAIDKGDRRYYCSRRKAGGGRALPDATPATNRLSAPASR